MPLELHSEALKHSLQRFRSSRFVVALSGGLDSVVLLHLLVALRDQGFIGQLHALHVNHQLSDNAASWQRHCHDLCESWRVDFDALQIDVRSIGGGIEEAARDLRYGVIEDFCEETDCIAFAHHQQDQVETLLYRMVRGSGSRGLGGMPDARSMGKSRLVRPLLPFSRQQIQQYADDHHLTWVEDESNQSLCFDRNFIRLQLLTVLRERWPNIDARLFKQAARSAEDACLLDDLAESDLQRCAGAEPEASYWIAQYHRLWLPETQVLSKPRLRNLLRYWLRLSGVTVPGEAVIEQVLLLIVSREDAYPLVSWKHWHLRRYQQYLVVMPADRAESIEPPQGKVLSVGFQDTARDSICLPDNGRLLVEYDCYGEGRLKAELTDLAIQYRPCLDAPQRIRVAGREGSKSLKKVLQEHHLPPWLRNRIPLLVSNNRVVAAPGLWISEGYEAEHGSAGWRLSWQLPNSTDTH